MAYYEEIRHGEHKGQYAVRVSTYKGDVTLKKFKSRTKARNYAIKLNDVI